MICLCILQKSNCLCVCVCVFGTGVTMKLMDEVAGIVAARHCNTNIVTASVDAINFHRKIMKGEDDVIKTLNICLYSISMKHLLQRSGAASSTFMTVLLLYFCPQ